MTAIRVYTQSGGWQDIAIVGPQGPPGAQGAQGAPGATGGQGLPVGGTFGQTVTKQSEVDYDARWGAGPLSAFAFAAGATYKTLDLVKYNNSVWQASRDCLGSEGYPGVVAPSLIASGTLTPPTSYLTSGLLGTWIDTTIGSSKPTSPLRSGCPMEVIGIRIANGGTLTFTSQPSGADWDAYAYLMKASATAGADSTIAAQDDDAAGHLHPAIGSIAVTPGDYFLVFCAYYNTETLPKFSQLQITLAGGATLGTMPPPAPWKQLMSGIPTGGAANAVLSKTSANDGDTYWRPSTTPAYVTTLPVGATDGQEVYLRIPSGSSGSYDDAVWHLRFRNSSNSWEFIGGASLHKYVVDQGNTALTTYADLGNAPYNGPILTPPVTGDYLFEWGANIWPSVNGGGGYAALHIGGVVQSGPVFYSNGAGYHGGGVMGRTILANGGTICQLMYKSLTAARCDFEQRWLKITPMRLSGT